MSKIAAKEQDNHVDRNQAFEVIIIGSGPAGYTAGVYTSRARLRTLIISGTLPGGQLMTTSEVPEMIRVLSLARDV